MKTGTAWPGGYYKFGDEGERATDGNLLYFIKPDDVPQYDWFAPNKTAGLYPGRAGERKKQHNRRKRKSKRGADRVFDPDGKRDNSARPGEKRAKIPARGRRSESQAQPGRGPHGVADAGEHDHKHGKRGRLQQQTQTGGLRDEAGRKQHAERGHKKIGAEADGRWAFKSEPAKQPPFKPGSQSCNGCSRPEAGQKKPNHVRFNLPTDEVGQIKETFQETQQKETDNHEINKTAVIVGAVAVVALLILASR